VTESETVTELTDASTGKWLIETQGSTHLWDLDEMTWVRTQRDGLNPMDYDGKTLPIIHVKRMPKVGDTFFVWTSDHAQAFYGEWHQSSTIKSITKVEN
jgi:hypothetical protein